MLVGRMIQNQVVNDANAAVRGLRYEPVEIRKHPILRIDIDVIRNVVAEIDLRRWVERRDPDGVDAKLLEVIEMLPNTVQVADAVAVRVGKAARIDLVDDGVAPPFFTVFGRRVRTRECNENGRGGQRKRGRRKSEQLTAPSG